MQTVKSIPLALLDRGSSGPSPRTRPRADVIQVAVCVLVVVSQHSEGRYIPRFYRSEGRRIMVHPMGKRMSESLHRTGELFLSASCEPLFPHLIVISVHVFLFAIRQLDLELFMYLRKQSRMLGLCARTQHTI